MSESVLPTGWIRGVLEPCLLAFLADGEAYGYVLAGRLESAGLGRVPGGSLYPALLRMEKHGLVSAEWRAGDGGPGRKYYRLTDAGRQQLQEQAMAWDRFAGSVSQVLEVRAR